MARERAKRPRSLSVSPPRKASRVLTTDTVIAQKEYERTRSSTALGNPRAMKWAVGGEPNPAFTPSSLSRLPRKRPLIYPPASGSSLQSNDGRSGLLAAFGRGDFDRHAGERRNRAQPPDEAENRLDSQGRLRPKFMEPAITCKYWLFHHMNWSPTGCSSSPEQCDFAHHYTGVLWDRNKPGNVIRVENIGYLYSKQFMCQWDHLASLGQAKPCRHKLTCRFKHRGEKVDHGQAAEQAAQQAAEQDAEQQRLVDMFIRLHQVEFDKFVEGQKTSGKRGTESTKMEVYPW